MVTACLWLCTLIYTPLARSFVAVFIPTRCGFTLHFTFQASCCGSQSLGRDLWFRFGHRRRATAENHQCSFHERIISRPPWTVGSTEPSPNSHARYRSRDRETIQSRWSQEASECIFWIRSIYWKASAKEDAVEVSIRKIHHLPRKGFSKCWLFYRGRAGDLGPSFYCIFLFDLFDCVVCSGVHIWEDKEYYFNIDKTTAQ